MQYIHDIDADAYANLDLTYIYILYTVDSVIHAFIRIH